MYYELCIDRHRQYESTLTRQGADREQLRCIARR